MFKIGIYTNKLPYPAIGGIQRYLRDISKVLSHLGYSIEFLVRFQKQEEKRILEGNEIHIWVEKHNISLNVINYLNENQLINLIKSFDCIIIAGSARLLFGSFHFVEILDKINLRTIFVVLFPLIEVEYYYGKKILSLVTQYLSSFANSCDYVVVPSHYVKNELDKMSIINTPIVQIPHGIRLEDYKNEIIQKAPRVIALSRIVKHKNINYLLKAWKIVKSQIPNATLDIIGPYETNTRDYSYEAIKVYGGINEKQKIYLLKHSRVFVLPSSIEAFGISYLEALAAGIPVVGLGTTAVPELIKHGINGHIVGTAELNMNIEGSPINNVNVISLANAISTILSLNNSQYKNMKTNCEKTAANFELSRIILKYVKIIGDVSIER